MTWFEHFFLHRSFGVEDLFNFWIVILLKLANGNPEKGSWYTCRTVDRRIEANCCSQPFRDLPSIPSTSWCDKTDWLSIQKLNDNSICSAISWPFNPYQKASFQGNVANQSNKLWTKDTRYSKGFNRRRQSKKQKNNNKLINRSIASFGSLKKKSIHGQCWPLQHCQNCIYDIWESQPWLSTQRGKSVIGLVLHIN